jgi:hypothetical protein
VRGKHPPHKTNCSFCFLREPYISQTLLPTVVLHTQTIAPLCLLLFPVRVLLPKLPLRLALRLLLPLPLQPCLPLARIIFAPHRRLAPQHCLSPVCCRPDNLHQSSWKIQPLCLGGQRYSKSNSKSHRQHRYTPVANQYLKMVGSCTSVQLHSER